MKTSSFTVLLLLKSLKLDFRFASLTTLARLNVRKLTKNQPSLNWAIALEHVIGVGMLRKDKHMCARNNYYVFTCLAK